ncbi:hypothetical protein Cni_G19823 [Canna indica]|uniref:Uncharacterized protein n=1 Tax=Canna indica TaxID=4628 RepID=A0AAQ3KQ76_9LILI|nr:hypothetical protein Cni_G19823 [Canna indica]
MEKITMAQFADDESSKMENIFKRAMPWLGEEIFIKDSQMQNTILPGLSSVQWMNMQPNSSLANETLQTEYLRPLAKFTAIVQCIGKDNPMFTASS